MVLMLEPENTGVWLDLYRGRCRSARAISAADWAVADYAISTQIWRCGSKSYPANAIR
ncbi:MAG: hypothetical protein R3C26_26620 [Calditrichia bacterium]